MNTGDIDFVCIVKIEKIIKISIFFNWVSANPVKKMSIALFSSSR